MALQKICYSLLFFILFFATLSLCKIPPYACQSADRIIKMHGYSYEKHMVTTEDGYILTIFRIVGKNGVNTTSSTPRRPLVMQHGISASCNCFLSNGFDSPAFYFFDNGFDVWLPNSRGTQYSKDHTKFESESDKYWDFSFEECGTMDTRAYMEYIYKLTYGKIYFIGHSQGFMELMAGFSLYPEYFKERTAKIMGWAPVVRIDLTENIFMILLANGGISTMAKLAKLIGLYRIECYSQDACMNRVKLCDWATPFCKLPLMFFGDFQTYLNNEYGQTYGQECSSLKNYEHLGRNIMTKGFNRMPNAQGIQVPYDLKVIQEVKIGICVGTADMLSTVANGEWMERVFKENGNPIEARYYPDFGHATFLYPKERKDHFKHTLDFFNE